MAIYNLDHTQQSLNEGYVDLSGKNKLKIKNVTAVAVHTIEGDNIPHFHLERKNRKISDTCVRLDTNEFFTHGNKEDMLNNSDCLELDRWLRLGNLKYPISDDNTKFLTNWQVLATMWNSRLTGMLDLNDQPDYSVIRPYK